MMFAPFRSGFTRHLAAYVSGVALMAGINLLTSPGDWWVQWPALGWGIGVLIHGLSAIRRERTYDERSPALALPDADVTVGEAESDAMVERAQVLLQRERSGH